MFEFSFPGDLVNYSHSGRVLIKGSRWNKKKSKHEKEGLVNGNGR